MSEALKFFSLSRMNKKFILWSNAILIIIKLQRQKIRDCEIYDAEYIWGKTGQK